MQREPNWLDEMQSRDRSQRKPGPPVVVIDLEARDIDNRAAMVVHIKGDQPFIWSEFQVGDKGAMGVCPICNQRVPITRLNKLRLHRCTVRAYNGHATRDPCPYGRKG